MLRPALLTPGKKFATGTIKSIAFLPTSEKEQKNPHKARANAPTKGLHMFLKQEELCSTDTSLTGLLPFWLFVASHHLLKEKTPQYEYISHRHNLSLQSPHPSIPLHSLFVAETPPLPCFQRTIRTQTINPRAPTLLHTRCFSIPAANTRWKATHGGRVCRAKTLGELIS